jgi:hypothetical protein
MCAWAGAPFPLQADAFSCRDALNFNRPGMRIINRDALFENAVNAQAKILLIFAFCSLLPRWLTLLSVGKPRNGIDLGHWTNSIC